MPPAPSSSTMMYGPNGVPGAKRAYSPAGRLAVDVRGSAVLNDASGSVLAGAGDRAEPLLVESGGGGGIGRPHAAIRNPNLEIRNKSESPKSKTLALFAGVSGFPISCCFGFRDSDFEFTV